MVQQFDFMIHAKLVDHKVWALNFIIHSKSWIIKVQALDFMIHAKVVDHKKSGNWTL